MRAFDVYWETSPLFSISKIFGIAPYNSIFRLSLVHTSITILFLSLILGDALYLGIYMEQVNDSYQLSGFSLMLERFQLIMVIVTLIVCMMKAINNVKLIRIVMETLGTVDDYLLGLNVEEKRERYSMYVTLFVRLFSLFSLIMVDLVITKMYRKLDSILIECMLMYPLIIINIVETQFIVLLNVVKKRLIAVKKKLNEITKKGVRNINLEILQTLATAHSTLVDICQDINSLYSHQILMIFSGIFILTTTNLYHVVEKLIVFVAKKDVKMLNFATITSYRVMVRAYEVWTVVRSCSKANEKAKEFNTQLYQLMIDDRMNDISNDKKLRLHIAMKRDVVFTACGFFTLDYTLVHSMIAAATTYLVILIQFGKPNSNSSPDASNNATLLLNTSTTSLPLMISTIGTV
ncbi:putative gustatory receptor 28a [Halyomorpha halys]|uniref:putative gustatory receptor 28a n=1 Tax=Halyomorpha halys TaxID=286706 RepID=UPI0006D4DF18|nr:putative gustatory receptor 28a [Halyomorpha halys]KAE8573178.1 Gustatory receptor 20b [Halyomorpha halys]